MTQPYSQNLTAFLDLIAWSEGTKGLGDDGYNKLVNPGGLFDSYASHPNQLIEVRPGLSSTAAGRYQFLSTYWPHYRDQLGLPDFGPASQDAWAVQLIREQRALADVEAGDIEAAVTKCANIWASLPGAGYNQPEHTLADLQARFTEYGGVLA
ncbi:glycoside hydrolase family 104 protein [Aeromonas enteropelogenes]|uniref:glycoside hydrolase family 24 protein n=1 Tax=Aeromonas enteropelogenes TaxID=29489 RepID=UPI00228555CD|nr:glycoside hydrolase family 104 protein [Aeromonas enteropelogenes]MCZ0751146.1 glycoside hydrolase family 104 protein [Aeromonas enteropelogenes]